MIWRLYKMFNISKTIRKLMIDKNRSVTDIANNSGLLQPSISRCLQKADNDYRINYLNQIIQALDCSIQIQIIDNNTNDILYTISDTSD